LQPLFEEMVWADHAAARVVNVVGAANTQNLPGCIARASPALDGENAVRRWEEGSPYPAQAATSKGSAQTAQRSKVSARQAGGS